MNYIRTSPLLSRRHLLRGMGAMLPLPFLEAMMPGSLKAAAATGTSGKPPVRLGLWLFPGGRVRDTWELGYTGSLKELSPSLKPFEEVKEHMLFLSGLSNKGKRASGITFNGHETCNYQYLTCAGEWTEKGRNTGRSFDQIAAAALQEETYLSSLEISTEIYKEGLRIWRNTDTPVTPETNLREAYERMFKGRKPAVPQWHTGGNQIREEVAKTARKETLQHSVIDLVLDDAKALRKQLGAVDANRLDQYMEAVRGFERQLDFAARQGAAYATAPGSNLSAKKADLIKIQFSKYSEAAKNSQTLEEHRTNVELMSDLMLLAFQTDTTRVCSLDISFGLKSYADLCTGPDTDFHPLQHIAGARNAEQAANIIKSEIDSGRAKTGGDSAYDHAIQSCTNITAFYSDVCSRMVQKAASIPEGNGTLLDNMMVMYSSYMATGGHTTDDYGVVLLGGGGGTLKTGRSIDFGKETPLAGFYAALLERMGVEPKEIIEVDKRTSPAGLSYSLSGKLG